MTGGNVYYFGAEPYVRETNAVVALKFNPAVRLVQDGGRTMLEFAPGDELRLATTRRVDTELLGKARVPGLPYVNLDDSPLRIDTDYFGNLRPTRPTPGPFESPGEGRLRLTVWNSPP